MMSYPKLDPNKTYSESDPNYTDPNAYWRNEYFDEGAGSTSVWQTYSGSYWRNNRWVSNYVVRGPVFRSGDILNRKEMNQIGYLGKYPAGAKSKSDAQVAIFADHEWANGMLGQFDSADALTSLGYDKPVWTYFPRRHIGGPVVAYTDGHAKLLHDESRQITWRWDGKYFDNFTRFYHNGWAMLVHKFDED